MKALKYLALVLAGVFLFIGCQKEFSYEKTPFISATGTLKNDSGGCNPITVTGSYSVGDSLVDSNYVTVQVNFTKAGSYVIKTDSSNGFSFKDSGSVIKTGLQSIRLQGTGKPLTAQITNFFVAFDTSVCTFSVLVVPGLPTAIYTLAGAPANCANATVSGVFEVGKPLDSTNKVSVSVDVTTPGRFSMTTGTVNGMTFAFPQGTFLTTGTQIVVLQGSGTPATEGPATFPISADGTSCSFTVDVNSMAIPGPDSAWQFSQGSNFYHGFIDTALTHLVKLPSGDTATALSFYGYSPGADSLFQLDVLLPQGTIETGIYNTDSANADFYLYNIDTTIKPPYYQADFTIRPHVNIQINIQTYDPVTQIVTGTFTGTARNAAGQNVTITGGRIYAKVD